MKDKHAGLCRMSTSDRAVSGGTAGQACASVQGSTAAANRNSCSQAGGMHTGTQVAPGAMSELASHAGSCAHISRTHTADGTCAAAQTQISGGGQVAAVCTTLGTDSESLADKKERPNHAAATAQPSAGVDAEVAAHTAVLGQNADRLFALLQRRQQQRQQEQHLRGLSKEANAARGTQQQRQQQHFKAIRKEPLCAHGELYGAMDMHERIGQQYIRL